MRAPGAPEARSTTKSAGVLQTRLSTPHINQSGVTDEIMSFFDYAALGDMEHIVIELSILTPPRLIEVNEPKEYLNKIKIGRDGLIAERGGRRGLLLPQVPVDHDRNWDVETFLHHTCNKAWLPDDSWKDKNTKIYSFQAILFEELEPRGEVVRKYLV